MSTARGRDRNRMAPSGRRHLVLVRGGLDGAEGVAGLARPSGELPLPPEDADWQAFCERIGWQHVETSLPDDYEERLAARIFGEDAGHDGRRPPAEAPVSTRVLRAGVAAADRTDDGWLGAGAAAPSRARRAFTAGALAVAAVLSVAASVVLWRSARPPLSAAACPDVEASPRATMAPVVDRDAPVDPSEKPSDPEHRSRPPRTKDASTRPAPREIKAEKPTPPGSRVAERSRFDGMRPRGGLLPFAMGGALPRARSGSFASSLERGHGGGAPMAMSAAAPGSRSTPFPRPQGVAVASSLPVAPHAWPGAGSADAWTRPASFAPGVEPASATWSLSPTSPRWFGVSLPPASTSAGPAAVPSGVGVMAQLDVTKALAGL